MKLKPQKHLESVPQEPRYYTYWLLAKVNGKWKSFDVRDIFTYSQCQDAYRLNPHKKAKYFESLLTEWHEKKIESYTPTYLGEDVLSSAIYRQYQEQYEFAMRLFEMRESITTEHQPIRNAVKFWLKHLR